MILQLLSWWLRPVNGPGAELYYLRKVLLRPMTLTPLSINPHGLWSPRKAEKVLEIINPQAAEQGIEFYPVSLPQRIGDPVRVLLQARCIEHQRRVSEGTVCKDCRRFHA